jgi:hypothetical protein
MKLAVRWVSMFKFSSLATTPHESYSSLVLQDLGAVDRVVAAQTTQLVTDLLPPLMLIILSRRSCHRYARSIP